MFSEILYSLRTNNNVSQSKIANVSGLSLRQYQRYEKNEGEPNMTALIKLADFFDVSIDYLVGRTDDPKRY